MIYEKPKNEIFASDAKDGEIVDFPNIKRGWGVTENLGFIPPMEYFNAAFNRVDKSLAYQLQRGVGEWDKDLEYPIGAVVSLNGVVYVAKSQNTNKNPANEATIWDIVATQKWCEDSFMKKTDKIDAYTKKESDKKFALKDDLPDIATETKEGIAKLKNAITEKAEDAAVTEKALVEFVQSHTSPSLGVAQSWSDVTSSRDTNITYTNTTDKPIMVLISGEPNMEGDLFIFVNGVKIYTQELDSMAETSISFIVPPKATYRAEAYYGNGGSSRRSLSDIFNSRYKLWAELK